jgi:hypothetical protein
MAIYSGLKVGRLENIHEELFKIKFNSIRTIRIEIRFILDFAIEQSMFR